MLREYQVKKVYQGSLRKGDDLIQGLTHILKEQGITCGVISGIGAVTRASLGYFNQKSKTYEESSVDEALEIVSLKGNISFRDGQIFPHLHIVLSRQDLTAIGGHLLPGTSVYAFEYEIIAFDGSPFIREFDTDTGLFLWKS